MLTLYGKDYVMSAKQDLERLLVDLVVVWPTDDNSPAIKAARSYLQTNCGIMVQDGEISYTIQRQEYEDLTDSWYSV